MAEKKNDNTNDYTLTLPSDITATDIRADNALDVNIYDDCGESIKVNAGDTIGSWTATVSGTYQIKSSDSYKGNWVHINSGPILEHDGFKLNEYVMFRGEPFKIASIQCRQGFLGQKEFHLNSVEDSEGKGYSIIVSNSKLLSRSESLDILYNGK